jgi:hypothetical protein
MDLYKGAGERTFILFRLMVFAAWAAKLVATPIGELTLLPLSAYQSIGIPLKYIPDFILSKELILSGVFLEVLKWSAFLVSVFAVAGPFKNVSAMAACVLLTVFQGLIRGFGFINHAEIPLLYAAYIVAAFPLFRSKNYQTPFILFLTTFLFTYSFIAAHRVAYGGAEVFLTDRISYWIAEKTFDASSYFQIGWGVWLFKYEWVRQMFILGFPFVTAVELLAPFSLVSRRFRWFFLAVVYSFHFMTWFFMDLLFWECMLLLLLLLDMSRWFKPRKAAL